MGNLDIFLERIKVVILYYLMKPKHPILKIKILKVFNILITYRKK